MKSRNLKAIFAALTTAAVMATATTSFAAVTSTATYNDVDGKVKINVDIDEDATVTYKATSGNEVVYIDQATADFSYYVASAKIADLTISVDSNDANAADVSLSTVAAPTAVAVDGEEGVMLVLQTIGTPNAFGVKAGDLKLPSLAPKGAAKAAIQILGLDDATAADFVPYAE